MVIILQERALGDDWRVAEAASWDFGGTRATIWGAPTHYSENQPQEMGPENGERKWVKKIGATRATIWGGPTHYSENPPPGNGERKWVKRWGQYSHYGGGCQNCYFYILVFRATILGPPNRKWVEGSFPKELQERRTQVGGQPPQKLDPWSMKSPHLMWPIIAICLHCL